MQFANRTERFIGASHRAKPNVAKKNVGVTADVSVTFAVILTALATLMALMIATTKLSRSKRGREIGLSVIESTMLQRKVYTRKAHETPPDIRSENFAFVTDAQNANCDFRTCGWGKHARSL